MQSGDTLIAGRDGRIGRILLNRPKALNAIDLPMIRACSRALEEWRHDPHVHAVVIEGAGDRAFCAGGDIRALRQYELDGEHHRAEEFFREEYDLNLAIATYPKPYIALIDGICMGGGIGVSVHAPYRVATEHAAFAMPETAIGFFPDIGATFFLPRLPGQIGAYLGLTGARMQGADAVHAGRTRSGRIGRARRPCRPTAGILARTASRCDRPLLRLGQRTRDRAPARSHRRQVVSEHPRCVASDVALGTVLDPGRTAPWCGAAAAAMPGGGVGADTDDHAPSRLRRGRARHGGRQGSQSTLASGTNRGG